MTFWFQLDKNSGCAMATYIPHRLKMGKVEIDNLFLFR